MGRHAHLRPSLTATQLKARYRNSSSVAQSRRWHLLWLLADGHTLRRAAELVGVSERYAQAVLSRYNKLGPRSLQARSISRRSPRRLPLLPLPLRRLLARLLQKEHPDGGLWTGPKVASWMARQLGRPVSPQRGWEYLKRLGLSWLRPRPRNVNTSPPLQEAWKKNSEPK